MLLENKVAIITGAASGIGKAIALIFTKEGADVVIADIDFDKAKKTAEEIEATNIRKALPLKVDVSAKSEVEEMVKKVMNKFGKIDILVNNAGIAKEMPLLEFDEEWWDKIINVNLKGAFLCIQSVGKIMVKQSRGKIINVSSGSAINPYYYQAAYGPSKAGMVSLTRNAALELGKYGINVNATLPGTTATEMGLAYIEKEGKTKEDIINETVLRRLGTPEDQAKVVLFLASELSDHVTGEAIIVSAGQFMRQ